MKTLRLYDFLIFFLIALLIATTFYCLGASKKTDAFFISEIRNV